jgi:hypothetical protein
MIIEKDNILRASEGYVLTNGEVYCPSVGLGRADKIENWHEITEEEYNAIVEQVKEEEKES